MKKQVKVTAAEVEALRAEWRTELAAMEDAAEAYKQTAEYKAYLVAAERKADAHLRYIDASSQLRSQN